MFKKSGVRVLIHRYRGWDIPGSSSSPFLGVRVHDVSHPTPPSEYSHSISFSSFKSRIFISA